MLEEIKLSDLLLNTYKNFRERAIKQPKIVKEIDKLIKQEEDEHNYIKGLIERLEDEKIQEVIYLRYFEHKTIQEIAYKVFHHSRHTSRLIKQGLEELEQLRQQDNLIESE